MTRTLATALLCTLPLAAQAQEARSLSCQTRGFCTNDVSCSPDDAVLLVDLLENGTALFGWDGQTRFAGIPVEKDGLTIYMALDGSVAVQQFTLADDLEATMSVQTIIFDNLYHSIQALTCVETVG
ncbi:MAG: hypothetical protein HLUCCA08_14030 [Rhodobacteraceae bacterium HLUCCA08]|nr:MAG: hypothetical protein HLUCCA08_14030 [Rhodobacteraceae bacterium HLUCCA08]